MNIYSMTDKRIAAELGNRIKALRLRKNITQQQLSEATVLSLNAIKALESGKGKLSTIIAVFRELGVLESLDQLLPEILVSPIQVAKSRGKVRQRASGGRIKPNQEDVGW